MVGGGRPLLPEILGQPTPIGTKSPGLRPSTTLRRINNDIITTTTTTLFTFDSIDLKFVTSKNAVNADRIMKFIDENELSYI